MRKIMAPPSKAHTLRAMILSFLGEGQTKIIRPLMGDDQKVCLSAIKALGASVSEGIDEVVIAGVSGMPQLDGQRINMANSGVTLRFLTSAIALAKKSFCVVDGNEDMRKRPVAKLVDALGNLGVRVKYLGREGFPPIEVFGGGFRGGTVELDGNISSQYLSSLVIAGACSEHGISVRLTSELVSSPYVEVTIDMMEEFGVNVKQRGPKEFVVEGQQCYRKDAFEIEGDYSSASYFFGASALTRTPLYIGNLNINSKQADKKIVDILRKMGVLITEKSEGYEVENMHSRLNCVTVDMSDCPDIIPTVAVLAAFAEGTTAISGVGHLRYKECDRLAAIITELKRIGIEAESDGSILQIKGGIVKGADIRTYNDHRIAMSFAMAALREPEINIENKNVVAKSFPDFFDKMQHVFSKQAPARQA
ncbi:MAG: 3-phosphoshikimate 1-carboxyvinyltransferase [Nitrospirae bacterium]|nr:3-phosphoshikimate 1-carboxyvinyltransferase [Nitrospirota bacterium]